MEAWQAGKERESQKENGQSGRIGGIVPLGYQPGKSLSHFLIGEDQSSNAVSKETSRDITFRLELNSCVASKAQG